MYYSHNNDIEGELQGKLNYNFVRVSSRVPYIFTYLLLEGNSIRGNNKRYNRYSKRTTLQSAVGERRWISSNQPGYSSHVKYEIEISFN